MDARADCIVIGAGVVGLAIARALALRGRDVMIVEAANAIGTGVSSRNSEVIHAGIHYPPGSLKAALCVRGKDLLYAYCAERHVPHRRIGKLVVATDVPQVSLLEQIARNAAASGVDDLEALDRAQASRLEAEVACVAALWSPSTGIVDSHALMLALLADAEAAGATLALSSRVADGAVTRDGIALRVVTAGDDPFTIEASCVVNCASLDASRLARSIDGVPADSVPDTHLVKGNYFTLNARAPFSHLIYPMPEPGSLGIHLTLDLAGQARFGPDVEWPAPGAALDYEVDERRADAFAASIRHYWPRLPDHALAPAYAGIRPRLSTQGQPLVDFDLRGPDAHGVDGLVNLFGIESPGLTSSLAIGEHVVAMLA